MFRKALLLVAMGSAVGVPYVATEWSKIKANFGGDSSAATSNQALPSHAARGSSSNSFGLPSTTAHPSPTPYQHPLTVDPEREVTPLVNMKEALRFNVSPESVMRRWPRVTSGLPDENLHGLRVTLITGLLPDDLAGALTYYFTPSQRCARITFSGTTGDPRRLVALAQEQFGFHPFNSEPGVQRYEIRWNGKAYSELLIRSARVVRSSSPNSRYEVQLAINDPAVR